MEVRNVTNFVCKCGETNLSWTIEPDPDSPSYWTDCYNCDRSYIAYPSSYKVEELDE